MGNCFLKMSVCSLKKEVRFLKIGVFSKLEVFFEKGSFSFKKGGFSKMGVLLKIEVSFFTVQVCFSKRRVFSKMGACFILNGSLFFKSKRVFLKLGGCLLKMRDFLGNCFLKISLFQKWKFFSKTAVLFRKWEFFPKKGVLLENKSFL